jgi:predicted phosphoribosyltransferase
VARYYESFVQTTDDEVRTLLQAAPGVHVGEPW